MKWFQLSRPYCQLPFRCHAEMQGRSLHTEVLEQVRSCDTIRGLYSYSSNTRQDDFLIIAKLHQGSRLMQYETEQNLASCGGSLTEIKAMQDKE